MSISYHTVSDFGGKLRSVVFSAEGLSEQPENVGDNTITFGYGYTFLRNNGKGVWSRYEFLDADLAVLGITLTETQKKQLKDIATSLNSKNTTEAKKQITEFATGWSHTDLTPTQAQQLFEADLVHQKDDLKKALRGHLGTTAGDAVYASLDGTRELLGILSLFYNAQTLVGKNLATALNEGNRAEAWYEIRYGSNKLGWAHINGTATAAQQTEITAGIDTGHAKRRYFESDLFGLYNDPNVTAATISDDEASAVYQMYTKHSDKIITYDAAFASAVGFGDMVSEANTDYQAAGLVGGGMLVATINALEADLTPAGDYLLQHYVRDPDHGDGSNISLLNIWVGLDDKADKLIGADSTTGGAKNGDLMLGGSGGDTLNGRGGEDVLYGEDGADTLDGGADNDVLIGGLGSDTLKGGAGHDTYVFNSGDGKDSIDDSDGAGRIKINGTELDDVNTASYLTTGNRRQWQDANGIRYTLIDGSLIDGTLQISGGLLGADDAITLKGFNNGELGITLKDDKQLVLQAGHPANPFHDADYVPPTTNSTDTSEGQGKTLTLALNAPARAGDSVTLALTGGDGEDYALVTGDDQISFSDGPITLTLAAGQTEIVFAFLSTGDIDADAALNLSATVTPVEGDPAEAGLTLNLAATLERDDTLYDSAGNDLIQAGGDITGGAANDAIEPQAGKGGRIMAGGIVLNPIIILTPHQYDCYRMSCPIQAVNDEGKLAA